MQRLMISCGKGANDLSCSVTMVGTEQQVLDLAVEHAVQKHGAERSEELVNFLREQLKAAPAGV